MGTMVMIMNILYTPKINKTSKMPKICISNTNRTYRTNTQKHTPVACAYATIGTSATHAHKADMRAIHSSLPTHHDDIAG